MTPVANSIRILRYRMLVQHVDPLTRELSIELTVHNSAEEAIDEVLFVEDSYRPGLRVLDYDDAQLALLPNEIIRSRLETSKEPEDQALLSDMSSHKAFLNWVVFPDGRALASHETRVLRFIYTDGSLHDYHWLSPTKLFFNIPEYSIEFNVASSVDFPHLVSVSPPVGHRVLVEEHVAEARSRTRSRPLGSADHYHINANGPLIDVAIPHLSTETACVRTVYGVYPERNEALLLVGVIVGLLVVSTGFLTALALLWLDPAFYGKTWLHTAVQALDSNAPLVGTSIVLLSAGFIGLASGSVFQRAKWWASASGVIAALGIFVSMIQGSST